jgi:hypothetical protein
MRNIAQYPIKNSEVVSALTFALERIKIDDIGVGSTKIASLNVALREYQRRDPEATAETTAPEHENTGVPEVVSSVG